LRDFLIVTKAIANPTRSRILKLLEAGEMCVCDIINVIGLKQSTISKQLNILKMAGLVDDRRDGTWIYYKLAEKDFNCCNLFFKNVLKKCLNDEEIVKKDKENLKKARCCKMSL
jgi:DNA-binding transcriptional ArsR family regulator